MNRSILSVATIASALFIATGAVADDQKAHQESTVTKEKDGSYNAEVAKDTVDAAGTAHHAKTKKSHKVYSDGSTKTKVKGEASEDPKGLLNKTKTTEDETASSDAKGNLKDSYTKDSVDSAGTAHQRKADVQVKVHSDGTSKATVTDKSVTDPKGLLNKHTTEVETTAEEKKDGSVVESTKKTVDGKVVEQH